MKLCSFKGPDCLDYTHAQTPPCCPECGGKVEWTYYSLADYSASMGPIRIGRKRLVCTSAGGYPRSTGIPPRTRPKGAGIWDD